MKRVRSFVALAAVAVTVALFVVPTAMGFFLAGTQQLHLVEHRACVGTHVPEHGLHGHRLASERHLGDDELLDRQPVGRRELRLAQVVSGLLLGQRLLQQRLRPLLSCRVSGLDAALLGSRRTPVVAVGVFAVGMATIGVAWSRMLPTYRERETPNHSVKTFRSHRHVTGQGRSIAAGQVVRVSCKIFDPSIPSVSPAGYWYRIASPPWRNRFFAPANTFLNGDPPHGPYSHDVDRKVRDCA